MMGILSLPKGHVLTLVLLHSSFRAGWNVASGRAARALPHLSRVTAGERPLKTGGRSHRCHSCQEREARELWWGLPAWSSKGRLLMDGLAKGVHSGPSEIS